MYRNLVSLSVILVLLVGFTSCASVPEEHKGATYGAGAGAALGTAAGAILGDTKGAVVGGLLGALVGGAIGHYGYDQRQTRQETVSTYNYAPTQGRVINIEQASVSPQNVAPGENVDMSLTYAVLSPSPNTSTNITETREITFQGQSVGKTEHTVQRRDGTFTSTVPLQLPQDAQPGQYTVSYTLTSDAGSDRQMSSFYVR